MNMFKHEDMPNELFKDLWLTIEKGEKWHSPMKNKKKKMEVLIG